MEWIEQAQTLVPPILYAPLASIALVLTLWLFKRVAVRRLQQWARSTAHQWDDILLESFSFPANFLILASGVVLLTNLLSLDEQVDRFANMALQGCVVFAIVIFLDGFLKRMLEVYSAKSAFSPISPSLTKGLVRGFIIGLGALIFLDLIGISITPILASLGIGSLAVALALQDTLSNFFAGIYVSIDRPVNVGDYIKLETGDEGYVIEIGWRNTRIRTLPNNVIVVPNSKLISSILTNYYMPDREIAVLVQVGVHYQSDLKHVERVTSEVGKQIMQTVPGGVESFDPFIRYHTFGDSSVNFTVILRGKEYVDQHLLKHEFIKKLHERYKAEGIVIPFPIRTLDISSEALSALKSAGR